MATGDHMSWPYVCPTEEEKAHFRRWDKYRRAEIKKIRSTGVEEHVVIYGVVFPYEPEWRRVLKARSE